LHQVDLAQKYADKIVGIFKGNILFEHKAENVTVEHLRVLYGAEGPADE
jgi:ABC-type phosphate/phosphonate transport system ATPase subunit